MGQLSLVHLCSMVLWKRALLRVYVYDLCATHTSVPSFWKMLVIFSFGYKEILCTCWDMTVLCWVVERLFEGSWHALFYFYIVHNYGVTSVQISACHWTFVWQIWGFDWECWVWPDMLTGLFSYDVKYKIYFHLRKANVKVDFKYNVYNTFWFVFIYSSRITWHNFVTGYQNLVAI